jgi:hypothetical protein
MKAEWQTFCAQGLGVAKPLCHICAPDYYLVDIITAKDDRGPWTLVFRNYRYAIETKLKI